MFIIALSDSFILTPYLGGFDETEDCRKEVSGNMVGFIIIDYKKNF